MEIFRVLDAIPSKTARVFYARDLDAAIEHLESAPLPADFGPRIIGRRWSEIPPRDDFIGDLLLLLADTALATYPSWERGEASLRFRHPSEELCPDSENNSAANMPSWSASGLLTDWLKETIACCKSGTAPLVPRLDREVQIGQLARVLHGKRLILLTIFECRAVNESQGKVLSDLIRWLVHVTGLRIGVFLFESVVRETRSLEGISYGAVELDFGKAAVSDQTAGARQATQEKALDNEPESAEPAEDTLLPVHDDQRTSRVVAPIIGMPHPFSPAEQELARHLEKDAELAGLFRYNWPVTTKRGRRHIVDLLWEGGGLVLEVDGYSTHTGRDRFQNDRTRDRELLLTDYRVARLTHDEIIRNPNDAIQLVRKLVRFCGRSCAQSNEKQT